MELPQPLQVTQSDIDMFLAGHGELMIVYYKAFLGDEEANKTFTKEQGLNGIYLSLKTQIQQMCYGSIDPTRSQEDRTKCKMKAEDAISHLCYFAIYHKDTISKAVMSEISALVYHLYSVHPIFDIDPVFKKKILGAIFAIGDHLKEI